MAEVAVSAVINKAVDIAANFIVEESSRLYWLPEDIRWLERQMRHMQAYLENAEAKKVTNPKVSTLIKDIRDLAHDVEDIFDTFFPRILSHRASGRLKRTIHILAYGRTCSKFSREIEKIKRRVQGIDEDRKNYGVEDTSSTSEDSNAVDPRPATLHFDDSIVVGFDRDIEELKTKLKEHQFVSIVGMPGLGKTTLAKKVFKGIRDVFDCSASVSVSQQPNIKSLLQDVAKQVGLEKEKQEDNLEVNLFSFLQEKRYILFLDDIWHTETWDSLKVCFPIDSESVHASRIIITSRDTGVGRYIGGENSLHQLHPFDDQTSWELFTKLIVPSSGGTSKEFDHSELGKIGKRIVEKCGGVPLAIVVTAGMLREKGMTEFGWNKMLMRMGQDSSDKCSQILGLSYMDLPIPLKSCFLYFGNFPEDYGFSASEVIRMWMAEKFIRGVGEWEPEDVGEDYISKLDARNLIQVVKREHDGRVKEFCVHDLLHNLCVNMGKEIDFLDTIDHLEASYAMKVRRLAVHSYSAARNDTLNYKLPKLRALFHFKFGEKVQVKHLKNMLNMFRLLRMLIMETTLKYLSLPTEIGSLSYLSYIQVKSDDHVEIPLSIQNLKDLQTLDVRGCEFLKLPIGIWKMKQLRHISVEKYTSVGYHKWDHYLMRLWWHQVEVPLPNVHTLAMPIEDGLDPSMLLKFINLRKLALWSVTPEAMELLCGAREPISKKLETLHCWSIGCPITRRLNLAKYRMLMELKISGVNLRMPQPLELPPSLIKLTLDRTLMAADPMETLKRLPKLKVLKMKSSSYFGSKMDCSGADAFPQLEVLQLRGLMNVEELVEGEEKGMPNLRQIIIQDCDKLSIVPERFQRLRILTNTSQDQMHNLIETALLLAQIVTLNAS